MYYNSKVSALMAVNAIDIEHILCYLVSSHCWFSGRLRAGAEQLQELLRVAATAAAHVGGSDPPSGL